MSRLMFFLLGGALTLEATYVAARWLGETETATFIMYPLIVVVALLVPVAFVQLLREINEP